MENTNDLLKKYYENYKEGRNNFSTNKEKAYEYFKESLDILQKLRKNYGNKIKKHEKLLEESESECYRYISLTLESTIETENKESKHISLKELQNELEKGDLYLIKKAKYGEIDFAKKFDYPEKDSFYGETILHNAIKNGDTTFLKYAFRQGARIDTTNLYGNTLLEYACLQEDPNMINFLGEYGANMQKHLYFRAGTDKYININNPMDICILIKIVLSYIPGENDDKKVNNKIYNKIKLLQNQINLNDRINLNEYTYKDLLIGLMYLLNKLPEISAYTYLDMITEELGYILNNKIGCPKNKLELILTLLVPFIDYPFNLSIDWIILLELKYLVIKLIKKKND
jgi:ankyrin repeat protein